MAEEIDKIPARFLESPIGTLAYRESGGIGPAVVLLHGNSSSGRCFARQMSAAVGKKYRLVSFDLPGHGESHNANDPNSYSLPGYASALTTMVKAVGLEDAVFVGWSLGGHIVLEAAPDLPEAAGFMIFGTPPLAFPPAMEQAFLPHPAFGAGFSAAVTRAEAEAYVDSFFKPGFTDIPPAFVEDVLRTDGRARANLAASIAPNGYRDEIQAVANLERPLAVVHGAQEQLVNGSYLAGLKMPTLWRGEIQTIDDAGHAVQWEQPAAFNTLLDAFVGDIRRA